MLDDCLSEKDANDDLALSLHFHLKNIQISFMHLNENVIKYSEFDKAQLERISLKSFASNSVNLLEKEHIVFDRRSFSTEILSYSIFVC